VLPKFAARLNAMKLAPGPAHLKLALAVDKEAGRADRRRIGIKSVPQQAKRWSRTAV